MKSRFVFTFISILRFISMSILPHAASARSNLEFNINKFLVTVSSLTISDGRLPINPEGDGA